MIVRVRTFVVSAGLVGLVTGAGCAGRQQQAKQEESPAAKQISASQERSQQALDQAAVAQREASDQARRAQEAAREAEGAESEARQAQERAVAAQQKAANEQKKAVQAQEDANRATELASGVAAQAQQQASQVLSEQEKVASGQRMFKGSVIEADQGRLVVSSERGPLSFALTPSTQVEVDGRAATLADIQPGADARVAYDISADGTTQTATRVMVSTGGATTR
jgi:colicin import membrane protein